MTTIQPDTPDTDEALTLSPPTGETDDTPAEREQTVAWFVATYAADYDPGVPHDMLMTYLLTERDAGPEQAVSAIAGAQTSGQITEPEPNHYRPADTTLSDLDQ